MSGKTKLLLAVLFLAALTLACGEATFPNPGADAPATVRFSGLYQCGTQRQVLEGYSDDGSCPGWIGTCFLVECY